MIDTNATFYKVLLNRRSIRQFQKRSVPRVTLEKVLGAALRAPSAHNSQPWRFVVLRNNENLKALASQMGQRLLEDLKSDGMEPERIQREVDSAYQRIVSAPINVLICLDQEAARRYPDERRSRAEYLMAVQGVAMAGENLLLAAHAEGLGACWLCAPLFVPELVRDSLELPHNWEPQGMILLGYPAESGRDKERHTLEKVALWK
jgi:F420 biosynthesis protein FbiB-like protein